MVGGESKERGYSITTASWCQHYTSAKLGREAINQSYETVLLLHINENSLTNISE